MKNSIIMPSKLGKIFIIESKKLGLINHVDMTEDFNEYDEWEEKLFSKYYQAKQNVFQILLLYDNIIIPVIDSTYEYSKLKDLGCFTFYSSEDFWVHDPIHEEGHLEYAEYLKPAIIPVITKTLKRYFPVQDARVSFKTMVSELYDLALGIKKETQNIINEKVNLNKKCFDIRQKVHYQQMINLGVPPDFIDNYFLTFIFGIISSNYRQLCWELEISSQQNAYIINCDYRLSKIGCDNNTKNISTYLDSYKILKCECSKIIRNLPKINNLYDVFDLKEKRKNDIKNLKEVLTQLEYVLKNEGKEQAIVKAANDVKKASESLAKRNELTPIGKWTTLFSVPLSVIEILCGLPPIGLALSTVGTGVCIAENILKKRNGWCEIVR